MRTKAVKRPLSGYEIHTERRTSKEEAERLAAVEGVAFAGQNPVNAYSYIVRAAELSDELQVITAVRAALEES